MTHYKSDGSSISSTFISSNYLIEPGDSVTFARSATNSPLADLGLGARLLIGYVLVAFNVFSVFLPEQRLWIIIS